ncbi:MAG TPA: CBS domain-containing protein [Ktedonobacteraceae bacterium]|nr:CBS domain-containing protein [Ktedonobacteraceae bacterium]
MLIVRDIMTTKLVTLTPDDSLAHAANLFRQHHFHHLPVVQTVNVVSSQHTEGEKPRKGFLLEGLLTSQDIDMASALGEREEDAQHFWQERKVVEVMHRAQLRVTPTTSVAAAAQLLVERNLNYIPVVEYGLVGEESKAMLVGLITRSDLLIALSRAMGALEPGMQLDIILPLGSMATLGHALVLASELHMQIRSVMAAPDPDGVPRVATVRLGTINPTPLLIRLKAEGIQFSFGSPLTEGEAYV